MLPVTNIAAYRFAPMQQLKTLRERLLSLCRGWQLKGTILLSTEGINLFVAGSPEAVENLLAELRGLPGLEDLAAKYSQTDRQPFQRMLVRIKREIIAFGVEGIDPVRQPAPRISPRQLKQWLDEGRPVVLLDTRNDYEYRTGTFRQALTLDLQHFRDFPRAVREQLPEALKSQTIVSFCTGGIRCEKAAPFLLREGFTNILQLEGGILKYFEECGGAHYEGECFVFDQRVGVEAGLQESSTALCYACREPLTLAEQADPRTVPGVSCPHCYRSPEEKREAERQRHQAALRRVADPLPGSLPQENRRPITVPGRLDRLPLLDFLAALLPHLSADQWHRLLAQGRLLGPDGRPVEEGRIVRAGERYAVLETASVEPEVNPRIDILYEDEAILVLRKPAPLPLHPGGRYHRNTLQHLLQAAYRPERPRPVHRLDANTGGLLLCARTQHYARLLHHQFAAGTVRKTYLAQVRGHPAEDHFLCTAAIGQEVGEIGSRAIDQEAGVSARTEFQVLRRYADGSTLLEVRPLTGRTNQIRLHLAHLGLPILGDILYHSPTALGPLQTLHPLDPPLRLHASQLVFQHPLEQREVYFRAPDPDWLPPATEW